MFRLNDHDDRNTLVISVSYGSTRKFGIRRKYSPDVNEVFLHNGDLLVMDGLVQDLFEHKVFPSAASGVEPNSKVRFNLTFRAIRRHTRECPQRGRVDSALS